ncbi:MAG: NAD-dependent epimerase/dehydratase family protein [Thermoleophilaceae bacterium]
MAGRRILITGVSSWLGTEVARRLEGHPEVEYVAGLDTRPPKTSLERTDFMDADIRNPVIAKLIPQAGVDTVVHNRIIRQPGRGLSPEQAHDINVIGSLQLLAACEKAKTVRTIIIRGSAGIYGSEPAAPQFFTEEMTRLYPLRTRFQRDVAEIENYFGTFARRHPQVTCTMLRYQPRVGPSAETQFTRYLSLVAVPTCFGFDPRVQLIDEQDAIEALVATIRRPVHGAVNVANPGTIGLTRMIRMAGKASVPVPHPLFGTASGVGKRLGLFSFSPDFRRLLQHGRAVDITRLVDEVGFTPRHSTVEAVADFTRTLEGRRLVPPLRRAVVPS